MESTRALSDRNAEAAHEAAEVRRREIVLLLILASVQFTSIVDFMVVMPLGPQLMDKLAIDPAQFSWIVASYTMAAGVAGLLGSSVMDRFGRKSAYLTLYAGFLLGTLLCGLSRSYAALLAARVVTGGFGGILAGLSLAIIADVFPEERRGRATGILMSAFAVASVVGVPTGISLGTNYGWQMPFLILAGLGLPVFLIGFYALPPLREHLHHAVHAHPLVQIVETFRHANYLRSFALTVAVMLGSFSVIPFISVYLVANVGVTQEDLPWVFVTGGLLTLFGAPLIGRLADRLGKLRVYRAVCLIAACLILIITNLTRVPLAVAAGVVGAFMLSNAGRMTAALAMISGSVERRRRGGFMSANSAVQHLSSGLGAFLGGQILVKSPEGVMHDFNKVGLFAVVATLLSLWVAGRVRPAHEESAKDSDQSGDFA
jgi:predicted MFS family arabinose efflux permease